MFWMFGSDEDSRPVAVAASAKEVCTRPVSRVDLFAERVGIGRFELGQLAPFEHLAPAPDAAAPAVSRIEASVP